VRLPDGLNDLAEHTLISFKPHHEALDAWAVIELIGHYVAYRKLVSPSPSELLPEDRFRLFAVVARYPVQLSAQVPWRTCQAGVYDCSWGTDVVRVVVAGQLPQETQNAPLHLFSASPELVGFGRTAYQRRSPNTSELLGQLLENLRGEGLTMSYTMQDFKRDMTARYLQELSPRERREVLQTLPAQKRRTFLSSLSPEERREFLDAFAVEERLAGLSPEEIRQFLDQHQAPSKVSKLRRKK
jgi:hypothetical protein